MSEQKLVCSLLDGLVMGNPMSDHDGIRCCPALKENSDEKYIVKIISVPASQVQLDALLLTGAHKDPGEAMDYFKEVADGIAAEAEALNTLSKLEGFLPFEGCQVTPMEDGKLGYEVCLLSPYRRSLRRYMQKNPVTHLDAVNLGLDLCASLAVCRRAGYLYIDLKPSNVFLSRDKQFRIGDLGFVKLDSLSYTSLPGQYRSPYVPREVQDDMKVLNSTVDTYALGMILYQLYNGGVLPQMPLEPKDPFPHPNHADYELSAIIMKALDPDPVQRWTDPMEMGQALVAYMQRNAVNNVPIAPPIEVSTADIPAEEPEQPAEEEAAPAETAPVSEETVHMADDEVLLSPSAAEEDDDLDFAIAFSEEPETEPAEPKPASIPKKPAPQRKKRRKNHRGMLMTILVLVILAWIACGGFWFYQAYYLKTVDSLMVNGNQHELRVSVSADIDTDLLTAVCTDTYGNSMTQPLVNGEAVFRDLLPDSLYRIELTVEGFHKLTGQTADIFTTKAMPTIISMSAVTGPEDGSVMVNFTVDGDEPETWNLVCAAPDEEMRVESFTGHSVTVKGLTLDKVYTLTLGAANGDQILGSHTIEFAAVPLVLAQNLHIADYQDGTMTVRWDAPANASVEQWDVRCYNDAGYEESLQIAGTEIAFTGIDSTRAYTVEVTAAGMTQAARVSISADPLTIRDLTVSDSDPSQLAVSWTYQGAAPEGGWLLMYTLDGSDGQPNVVKCDTASAVITPRIPSAAYHFTIQAADSTSVFNGLHRYTCPSADVFTFQGLSANNITGYLLVTPEEEGWTVDSVGEDAFQDTFRPGESISVALIARDDFYLPNADIDVMYVIRGGSGSVLSQYISDEVRDWKDIWYDDEYHNGELTIPTVPQEPGDYSVSIYFNGLAVSVITFTISE